MALDISIIGDSAAPYAYIGATSRAIGSIIPDVTIEEDHEDVLEITQHPVETGAKISDHASRQPARVDIHVGFSNSSAQSEGYVQSVYEMFLALQRAREPFSVSTGKRNYSSMLINNLVVTTDSSREYSLDVVVTLREVIIASTQTTGGANSNAPAATTPTRNDGLQNPGNPTTFPPYTTLRATGDYQPNIGNIPFPTAIDNPWGQTGDPALGSLGGVGAPVSSPFGQIDYTPFRQ